MTSATSPAVAPHLERWLEQLAAAAGLDLRRARGRFTGDAMGAD